MPRTDASKSVLKLNILFGNQDCWLTVLYDILSLDAQAPDAEGCAWPGLD